MRELDKFAVCTWKFVPYVGLVFPEVFWSPLRLTEALSAADNFVYASNYTPFSYFSSKKREIPG